MISNEAEKRLALLKASIWSIDEYHFDDKRHTVVILLHLSNLAKEKRSSHTGERTTCNNVGAILPLYPLLASASARSHVSF